MFPVARGAKGQPPMPPTDASSTVAPASTAASAFAIPGVARVVQVGPDGRSRAGEPRPTRSLTCSGHRDADRCRRRRPRRRSPRSRSASAGDVARVDRALERAAEGDADRDGRADAVGAGALDDPLRGGERLLDGRVLVAPVEGLGRGEGEVHLVEPGRDEPVVPVLVEREARVDDARRAGRCLRRPPRRRPSAARSCGLTKLTASIRGRPAPRRAG